MGVYYYILVFLIGLAVGSFFNVVIFRFNSDRSITRGRSMCLHCKSTIKWLDLIPFVSFLVLKGRCRNCEKKISPIYPATELTTALVILAFLANIREFNYIDALNLFVVLILVLIIFIDLLYLIIPDKLVILLFSSAVVLKIIAGTNLLYLLIYALGLSSFFAILFIMSRGRWIGLGDIKLILWIGFMLEYPLGYLAVVLSIWVAAIFSVTLLATQKAGLKTKIPFGSFLSISTIIFIIFYHEIQKITQYF